MAQKSGTLNKPMTFSAGTVVLFAFIFGVVGGYALFKSFAASHNTSSVTLTQTSAASTISGGSYQVQLNSTNVIKNKYNLWGARICTDSNGTTNDAQYHAVEWSSASSNTGTLSQFSPPSGSSSQCRVYVALFPDVWTPVSNTITFNP